MDKPLRIALAGNPNTGKSTVFNALTGLHQHTGNWSGKTVDCASGFFRIGGKKAELIDLPGIYSLFSEQAEESCAGDFLSFGEMDAILIVLDASCLERNLPLALQLLELSDHVVLCLNLMDEAKKKGICINTEKLSDLLGVPVVPTAARSRKGLPDLLSALEQVLQNPTLPKRLPYLHTNDTDAFSYLQEGCASLLPQVKQYPLLLDFILEQKSALLPALQAQGYDAWQCQEILLRAQAAQKLLTKDIATYQQTRALLFQTQADTIAAAVCKRVSNSDTITKRMDHIMLHKRTGIPCMLLLLCFVFWITVAGANVPSAYLMAGFEKLGDLLRQALYNMHTAPWLIQLLMDGVYLTVSWVVSVMLPPMAIFFPLFTLLEDFGLLPRIAFQMDGLLQKAGAHGKQALTLCMGFGCNAAGVTACRIIDSPRERLIAILTNAFVPCNGRFPTIILLASIFLSAGNAWLSGIAVICVVFFSVLTTLAVSFLLSRTVLRGVPSSFVLELPPYRMPQVGRVLVRSLLDRTIFVLWRAILVAVPAGVVIWLFQNIYIGDMTLLGYLSTFLDPLGNCMGLSGVILAAFLLGMPANEIVLPILLMVYTQNGMLVEAQGMAQAGALLSANGWTWCTALCAILFSLNHFPCTTTLLTIHKECGSWKWTLFAFALPTVIGICLCMLLHGIFGLFGIL